MSWCAGFTPAFWEGYWEVAPKAPLFEERRDLWVVGWWIRLLGARARQLQASRAAAAMGGGRWRCPPV